MKRRRKRKTVYLLATFAALIFAGAAAAQTTQSAAEAQGSIVVQAPAWEKGEGWAKFDEKLLVDFANLERFHDEDAKLGAPAAGEERVVFMGDSITEGWKLETSFPGKTYINRGIGGQSSSQMVLRFRQDVIDLKPKAVLILAGTNDFAGNTGPVTLEQLEGNSMSMADLANANGIRVVMCSVLPSVGFRWHPEVGNPAPRIAALNQWMKGYAADKGYVYVDYYSAMKDEEGGLPKKLSADGVHPTAEGYALMAPLAEAGIAKALKEKGGETKASDKN